MKSLAGVMKFLLLEKRDVFLSVLFGFIAGITAVGLFSASGYLIAKAALAPPLYMLMIVVSIVKLLGIISAVSRYGERYYSHRATFTMLSNIRTSFYERLEPLAPKIFHQFRSGDLLARIVGDVETLQNFFLRVFYPPMVLFLVFLATILFTAYFSVSIALILLLGYFLTTIVVPALFTLKQRNMKNNVRQTRSRLSTEATELLYGFRDLKIYQQLEQKEQELLAASQSYIEEQGKNNSHQLFSESVNTFVSLFISWTVLAVAGWMTADGQLNGIFLTMLVMISLTVFENTSQMGAFSDHYSESRQAAERLEAVVGREAVQDSVKVAKKRKEYQTAPHIEMKQVSFSYPGDSQYTLKDVSITFPSGSKTAIVGPSGSGKTTVMQLLLKIYTPNRGSILIDGESLEEIHEESIWKHTNAVLQSNHFFYGTIRENLLLDRNVPDEQLNEVLAKVNLSSMSLDDTVLEKGENLSGGEKQRLAIARAMLKDAPIWLLDEPTSSLDALTEKQIYEHLFKQAEEDTVIFISHRLIGMEKMDQIIVMEEGRILEQGTYDELMEKEGYFYHMKQIERDVFAS